jgi:ubiquinone/menaquinone biosynthesis C-methylase UbiE
MGKGFDSKVDCVISSDVDGTKMRAKIDSIIGAILNYYRPNPFDTILVAGCGDGTEAKLLQEYFKLETYGVDISLPDKFAVATQVDGGAILKREDLTELGFQDNSFNFIYSYHVLEHVSDHRRALAEISRVLRPKGVVFIGFPNKKRLVGYIGHHVRASAVNFLRWNLRDLNDRIHGRFENRLGAHAGFTEEEFLEDSKALFSKVIPIRSEYMHRRYSRYQVVLNVIERLGLASRVYPSNYFICIR